MDPTKVRLSPHFLLSDFLGNQSVYSRGFANMLDPYAEDLPLKMANARALCNEVLEPLLEQAGPMTVSYGYICPELSRRIVTYQDPGKPSHHRWDLGAAADVCVHEWTNHDPDDDTTKTAPITLAHEIHQSGYPYSRLISYSESPYLCIAVSAQEVRSGNIRKAFYENRYTGVARTKPHYKNLSAHSSKDKARQELERTGLPHGWRGAGHPTYHGGGRRQYHHIRTSKYTMLSDWLFDLKSISKGERNTPQLSNDDAWNAFCAAGDVYDALIELTGLNRINIISAYINPANSNYLEGNDWRNDNFTFRVSAPEHASINAAQVNKELREFGGRLQALYDNEFIVYVGKP